MAKIENIEGKRRTALNMYLSENYTNLEIVEHVGVTEPTFYNWRKAGYFTNGVDWQDYRDELRRGQLQRQEILELEKHTEDNAELILTVKKDLRLFYDQIKADIVAGKMEFQFRDIETLLKLYSMLDTNAEEKIEWMNRFALATFEIVFEIMDERQFALFKTRMLQLKDKYLTDLKQAV